MVVLLLGGYVKTFEIVTITRRGPLLFRMRNRETDVLLCVEQSSTIQNNLPKIPIVLLLRNTAPKSLIEMLHRVSRCKINKSKAQ